MFINLLMKVDPHSGWRLFHSPGLMDISLAWAHLKSSLSILKEWFIRRNPSTNKFTWLQVGEELEYSPSYSWQFQLLFGNLGGILYVYTVSATGKWYVSWNLSQPCQVRRLWWSLPRPQRRELRVTMGKFFTAQLCGANRAASILVRIYI